MTSCPFVASRPVVYHVHYFQDQSPPQAWSPQAWSQSLPQAQPYFAQPPPQPWGQSLYQPHVQPWTQSLPQSWTQSPTQSLPQAWIQPPAQPHVQPYAQPWDQSPPQAWTPPPAQPHVQPWDQSPPRAWTESSPRSPLLSQTLMKALVRVGDQWLPKSHDHRRAQAFSSIRKRHDTRACPKDLPVRSWDSLRRPDVKSQPKSGSPKPDLPKPDLPESKSSSPAVNLNSTCEISPDPNSPAVPTSAPPPSPPSSALPDAATTQAA